MIDWLELIEPHTKRTLVDTVNKRILLVHPHFQSGQAGYRLFLKSFKQNKYSGYTVEGVGMASIKGFIILKSIQKYLKRLNNVEEVQLNSDISSALYRIKVTFK